MEERVSSRSAMPVRYVTGYYLTIGPPTDWSVCQNFPEHQFPSIVGRPILRTEEQAGDIVVKDIMCGEEAAAARSMLQISYPVRRYCMRLRASPFLTPPLSPQKAAK